MNIEASLKDGMKKFKSLSKAASKNPDQNHVHDLRVITRRLRADFWLIPRAKRTGTIRKARSDLRKLTSVLGVQRKYDVALEDARVFERKTKPIKRQLRSAKKDVLKALRFGRVRRYMVHLKQAAKDIDRISPSAFAPRIDSLCRRLERAMHRPPKTVAARHHLRIEVKKARYLLEALNHELPQLTKLQDNLGRWHDLMVLSGLSGHPKDLVEAHRKQWQLVEPSLGPVLQQATRALSKLAADLRSSSRDSDRSLP